MNEVLSANWNLDIPLCLQLVAVLAGYVYAIGPFRFDQKIKEAASATQISAFVAGITIFAVAVMSPIDSIGEKYFFWMHMVQHLILVFLVPALLIVGTPGWIIDWAMRLPGIKSVLRYVLVPLTTFLISQLVLVVWHVPVLYQAALRNSVVHDVEHLMFIAAGILIWWPVLSRSKLLPRAADHVLLIYLFLLPVPTSILGAMIAFSEDVLYPLYAIAPRYWDIAARSDQELAGLLMWVPGKLVFWLAIGIVFVRWFRKEKTLVASDWISHRAINRSPPNRD